MKEIKWEGYTKTLKQLGIAYLGGVSTSHKLQLSEDNGTMTYGLYLAPADMSGYNVCPFSKHCRDFCLNGSGQNKCDTLAHGTEGSKINMARIKRTRLFFENRPVFMRLLCHEIDRARNRADRLGYSFAVRLNCTSDLSPELFKYDNLNILEIFPDIQFYDYTKVPTRLNLPKKYENYDVTFSYDGHNWDTANQYINVGGRVAVVFRDDKVLPSTFHDIDVVDGNRYDMRYLDGESVIVGLFFHKTANNYKVGDDGKRHFVEPNSDFVVRRDNPYVNYKN